MCGVRNPSGSHHIPMGYVHATIALSNSRRPELDPLPLSARTDSGARMLCIPAPLAAALQVQQESLREVSVADATASGSEATKKAIRVDRRCVRWWKAALAQAEPTPT